MDEQGTIVVSPESWHRRIYGYWARKVATKPPATDNLCLYVRAVVIYMPLWAVMMAFLFLVRMIAVVVTSPIWVPVWALNRYSSRFNARFGGWLGNKTASDWIGIAIVGFFLGWLVSLLIRDGWMALVYLAILIGIFILCVFLVGLASALLDVRRRRKRKQTGQSDRTASSVSLVWSWIKAKKKKICPIIVTEGEEKEPLP